MIQPSGNKIFTAADIERYHAGTLPAEERHALEKAALDDPFLADALEGFALTPTPAADLQALRQRLAARTEDKKVRSLFAGRRAWMNVAALIVVVAAAGWLATFLFQSPGHNIAVEKVPEPPTTAAPVPKENATNSAVTADSSFMNNQLSAAPDKARNNSVANSKAEARSADANDMAVQRQDNSAEVVAVDSAPYKALSLKDMAMNEKFKASVDSNAGAVTTTAMARSARKMADTVRNVNVVLKPLNQAPSEVVVLNKEGRKLAGRSRYENVKIDTLEPAEGWVKFDDYVANNLQTPPEMRAKPEPGEVQLAFDVNSQGEPVNITVVKSLCAKCDEEAIRLLKEGPRWKKKKKGKGKVTIRF